MKVTKHALVANTKQLTRRNRFKVLDVGIGESALYLVSIKVDVIPSGCKVTRTRLDCWAIINDREKIVKNRLRLNTDLTVDAIQVIKRKEVWLVKDCIFDERSIAQGITVNYPYLLSLSKGDHIKIYICGVMGMASVVMKAAPETGIGG